MVMALTLFKKADQAYTWLKDNGSLLTKMDTDDLKHLIRFLCHIKKTKGDTFSKHSGIKKKMRERIAGSEPLWTSYFVSLVAEQTEEEPAESGIDESNIENLKMMMKISAISLNTKGANWEDTAVIHRP